jgi:hypothetical protein
MTWRRAGAVWIIGVVATLLMAAAAQAQGLYSVSGAVTRAHATPSWTQGTVAGSVTFTCQPEFECGTWQPYLEVAPNPYYDYDRCESNLDTIWQGVPQTANGTQSVSLPKISIFDRKGQGIFGQHLCLGFSLAIKGCTSPLIHECNVGEYVAIRDLAGRNPCKAKRKNLPNPSKQLTVRQVRKKFCPGK